MPLYRYRAVGSDGKFTNGVITADSGKVARQQIRTKGLTPIKISQTGPGRGSDIPFWKREFHIRSAFGLSARALFIRQLSSLIDSGLSVERALEALQEEVAGGKPRQRNILTIVHSEVKAGAALSVALAQFPREFSTVECAVIAAGEQSGQLAEVMSRLADDLETANALRTKIMGAALYPAIVSFVALLITAFLLGSVVPQVTEVFTSNRYALPPLTLWVVALSDWFSAWGLVLMTLIFGAVLFCYLLIGAVPAVRMLWDRSWLRVPLFGNFIRGYNAARFAATLALLVSAGVPIIKALQTASATVGNTALRRGAMDATISVSEGAPLALALESANLFPRLLIIFIRLGEKTGDLPMMLGRASSQLGGSVQRRALMWATVLEPLLIVLMGGVVMVIVLAVLLPIIQLNQWVR